MSSTIRSRSRSSSSSSVKALLKESESINTQIAPYDELEYFADESQRQIFQFKYQPTSDFENDEGKDYFENNHRNKYDFPPNASSLAKQDKAKAKSSFKSNFLPFVARDTGSYHSEQKKLKWTSNRKNASKTLRPRHTKSINDLQYLQEQNLDHNNKSPHDENHLGKAGFPDNDVWSVHETPRTPSICAIHMSQWKKYGIQIQTWCRRIYRQNRAGFSHPPTPPRHLILGIPKVFTYFFSLCLFRLFSFLSTPFSNTKTRTSLKKTLHTLFLYITIPIVILLLFVAFVVGGFLIDAINICKQPIPDVQHSPISYDAYTDPNQIGIFHQQKHTNLNSMRRPLIEYYVHGRGKGHYSRSVAIIQKLNAEGYDVRMFIGRASMWQEIHNAGANEKDKSHHGNQNNSTDKSPETLFLSPEANLARRVAQLLLFSEGNNHNEDDVLQHDQSAKQADELKTLQETFFNLPWENEYALHYNFISNPGLSLVDEDEPQQHHQLKQERHGEFRGTTTAISVSSLIPNHTFLTTLSHAMERITGDCEVSRQKSRYPNLIVSDGDLPGMMRAKFGNIPSVSISHGLTFAISETNWADNERNWKGAWENQRFLNKINSFFSDWQIGTNFLPLDTKDNNSVIARPPFRKEVVNAAKIRYLREQRFYYRENKKKNEHRAHIQERNKLVLCYFRDKNGADVVEILLGLGFDVMVFIPAGGEKGKEIGKRWKITQRTTKTSWSRISGRKLSSTEPLDVKSASHDKDFNAARMGLKAFSNTFNNTAAIDFTTNDHTTPFSSQREGESGEVNSHEKLLKMLTSTSNVPKRIQIYDQDLFVHFMGIADGIIGSGGSQLLSESIFCRIPMLGLYRDGDDEQMLNIEMIRRKRDKDLEIVRNTAKANAQIPHNDANWQKLIYDPIPNIFGTSIGTLLKAYSKEIKYDFLSLSGNIEKKGNPKIKIHDSNRTADVKDEDQSSLDSNILIAQKELEGFINAVRNSNVSSTYYDDLFYFLNSPNEKEQAAEIKKAKLSDAPFPNRWLDGMPDAAQVIIEVVNKVLEN